MASKPFIYLEYKREGYHWQEYDRTQVPTWADTQMKRMMEEHPDAEYRRRRDVKK